MEESVTSSAWCTAFVDSPYHDQFGTMFTEPAVPQRKAGAPAAFCS
jgi:hypothetical protein